MRESREYERVVGALEAACWADLPGLLALGSSTLCAAVLADAGVLTDAHPPGAEHCCAAAAGVEGARHLRPGADGSG